MKVLLYKMFFRELPTVVATRYLPGPQFGLFFNGMIIAGCSTPIYTIVLLMYVAFHLFLKMKDLDSKVLKFLKKYETVNQLAVHSFIKPAYLRFTLLCVEDNLQS